MYPKDSTTAGETRVSAITRPIAEHHNYLPCQPRSYNRVKTVNPLAESNMILFRCLRQPFITRPGHVNNHKINSLFQDIFCKIFMQSNAHGSSAETWDILHDRCAIVLSNIYICIFVDKNARRTPAVFVEADRTSERQRTPVHSGSSLSPCQVWFKMRRIGEAKAFDIIYIYQGQSP
ncbi:hypothetical protein VTK73DRAFT_5054 [Phialemonium thermophilum]|uniref:Uncharacterized protein n=1 Tax=Phialemonium thermophilum TaxID=223376 RepID=A0ABR3V4H6_9PEZI